MQRQQEASSCPSIAVHHTSHKTAAEASRHRRTCREAQFYSSGYLAWPASSWLSLGSQFRTLTGQQGLLSLEDSLTPLFLLFCAAQPHELTACKLPFPSTVF